MQKLLLLVGKTEDKNLKALIDKYHKRILKYHRFDIEIIPEIKNSKNISQSLQKSKEGELIIKKTKASDCIILLDENGKQYDSLDFSKYIEKKRMSPSRRLIFIVGGPYGFSDEVIEKSHEKLSLSKMTFSNQMIRLFFVEQLYRANTILKNEPYHHQ
jgi:23S rRNA (pseudouridine1915-N3)-methyltransferase